MNFIKSFNLLGIEAQQIPCIELNGKPTTATEGAVGSLCIDSNTNIVYKCVAINKGSYIWERVNDIKPNLFDFREVITGYLGGTGGMTNQTNTYEITSNFIEVITGKKYTIQTWFPKSANASPWIRVCYYDENYAFLNSNTFSSVGNYNIIEDTLDGGKHQIAKLIIQPACKYIKFSTRTYSNVLIKFEQGWEMTPYCDYVNYNINDKVSDYDYIVKSINHRGLNKVAPENTLSAYRASAKAGFKYVETDIAWTSDRVPVLSHDNELKISTDGVTVLPQNYNGDTTTYTKKKINEMTLEQVKALDFGSWFSPKFAGEQIPTFDEFINLCKMLGLHPYIQVNSIYVDTNRVNALITTVKKYRMLDNVTWTSFSANDLSAIKNTLSNARLGYLTVDITDDTLANILSLKTDDNEVFLNVGYTKLSDDNIQQFIENDIPVEVYTVDTWYNVRLVHPYVTGMTTEYTNCGKGRYHLGLL